MAEFVHEDVSELILIRLDVKDLIRCKSVCKSWYSLITSPRFINRHSYNKDRFNNELGHRRIILLDDDDDYDNDDDHHLVGSSNGLDFEIHWDYILFVESLVSPHVNVNL
ncbi:hypothetical protein L1987_04558 [Smallanthus sonchifolius]|uniref:Uncharacterized protein n=1 Tax=Smallanthus sonchifolius TaxID=185202 RepID=A0ACB9JT78_9ASTR|nr:hypothetical protein L1987_04558 [Smallanthus sonchifolius]